MKRGTLYLLLFAALCLTLRAPALAAEDVSGRYRAVGCERDGERYVCAGDYVALQDGGNGEACFSEEVLPIQWSVSGGELSFVDANGFEFSGVCESGVITGNYAGFDYVSELDAAAAPAVVRAPVTASEPAGTPAPRPEVKLPDRDSPCGVYRNTERRYQDAVFSLMGEYIVLNEDGGGMLFHNDGGDDMVAYSIRWTLNGTDFSFTDNEGRRMAEASLANGVIKGEYRSCEMTFEKDDVPPDVMYLSPETWGRGLPYVTDQAGILTDEEEAALSAEAEAISGKYNCNVYIIALDDYLDFTGDNPMWSCAEEIQAGYLLGYGDDLDYVCLTLSMAGRDYVLSANGDFGNSSFTDYGKIEVEAYFTAYFKNDNWNGGFRAYLAQCDRLLKLSSNGNPLDEGDSSAFKTISAIVSLIIAAIASAFICAAIKRRMCAVQELFVAKDYIAAGGCMIAERRDDYINTTVSRVYDPPSKSGGRGGTRTSGSGRSHSSGKF